MEARFPDYLRVLRKRGWLVGLVLVASLATAGVLTHLTVPLYQAEAKLFVGFRQVPLSSVAEGRTALDLSAQLLQSYAEIVRTRPIMERAIRRGSLDMQAETLRRDLEADPIFDTQVLKLSYRSPDPAIAQRTVNAVANTFVSEIEKLEVPTTGDSQPAIKVSVVESAVRPQAPASPDPVRNSLLAAAVGVLLGVGLAFVLQSLDSTVKDKRDVEDNVGLQVLATVPTIRSSRNTMQIPADGQSPVAESLRKLCAAIELSTVNPQVKTVLVTSPDSEAGKTFVALNLAAVYASAGDRTLLLEADLRRPDLGRTFSIDGESGLVAVLRDHLDGAKVGSPTPINRLFCLPAGGVPPNPAELLRSDRMFRLLVDVRRQFDTLVVDAPPMLAVADATVLVPSVDGVLLVARPGQTRRDRIKESAELVERVGGRLLGVVLNGVSVNRSDYDSYYGYGPTRRTWRTVR